MDWIKVENKLPEHNQWVLTWWDGCKIPMMAIFKTGKKNGCFISLDGVNWMVHEDEIKYWTPVPEEPREGVNVADTESKLNLADVSNPVCQKCGIDLWYNARYGEWEEQCDC